MTGQEILGVSFLGIALTFIGGVAMGSSTMKRICNEQLDDVTLVLDKDDKTVNVFASEGKAGRYAVTYRTNDRHLYTKKVPVQR